MTFDGKALYFELNDLINQERDAPLDPEEQARKVLLEQLVEDIGGELSLRDDDVIEADYFSEWVKDSFEPAGGSEFGITGWPIKHIDWEAAAEEIRHQYTPFAFEGVDYLRLS